MRKDDKIVPGWRAKKKKQTHKENQSESPKAASEDLAPGMKVETTGRRLEESDISKPKVKEVLRGEDNSIEQVVIQKGVIFRKKLALPGERVQEVEKARGKDGEDGNVLIGMKKQEAEVLGARSRDGMPLPLTHRKHSWWRLPGSGFLSGMAGNDSSAVGTYSVDGARVGMAHLWLMLLSTPLYQAVQYSCAKIGQMTGQGLSEILRTRYSRPVATLAALVLIIANLALMTADLVAISAGLELLTNISWVVFLVPVALIIWYLVVFGSFAIIKKIFIGLSLVFGVYLLTAVLARPSWGAVLVNTFVPHLDWSFGSISSAVALLGATISPYTMYWQTQSEKEERRPGKTHQAQVRFAALDIALGAIGGNLIAYCIMLTTATTLFVHHRSITTVIDAAMALAPLLGPFARYLFALGFIGAGMIALPVLLASTSYAVTGTFGWPGALSQKPWQNEGFYLILTASLLISLILALLRLDPIFLMVWANILNGILSPVLMAYIFVIGNSRKIMRGRRLSWLTNLGLILVFLLMTGAAALVLFGLLTGQGGS